MKKSFVTIALLIGLSAVGFASTQPVVTNNPLLNGEKPELTQTETNLLNQLNAELEVTLDEVLASLEDNTIEKVLVYNTEGELILTQEKDINLEALPTNTSLLMTEGTTQYYIAL